jgi:hypothetical protein
MSYNSKRTLVSTIAGIVLVVSYIIYALGKKAPAPENIGSWAITMLVFIGIGVAAMIVIQILFHIGFAIGIAVKEREHDQKNIERIIKSSMVEDERDKLISLKSSRIGYIFASISFAVALLALALGLPAVVALHILAGGFAVGSLIEGAVSVFFYEKGVRNG